MKASRPAKWLVGYLCVLAVLPLLYRSAREWDNVTRFVSNEPAANRAGRWIRTSQCSAEKGVLLAFCGEDGSLIPFEEISPADDMGHVLALDVWSILRKKPATYKFIGHLNVVLNALALIFLALTIWWRGHPGFAAATLVVGSRFVVPHFPGPDINALFPGLLCLIAASLMILLRLLSKTGWTRREAIAYGGMVFILIGTTYLFRQPLGLVGLVCSSLLTGLACLGRAGKKRSKEALRIAIIGLSFWAVGFIPAGIILIRDAVWDLRPTGFGAPTHGVGHALFLGLTSEEVNPFGILWNDDFGKAYAAEKRPDVVFLSPEYYRFMLSEYVQRVMQHPGQVLQIYFAKLKDSLKTLGLDILDFLLVLSGILGILVFRSARVPARDWQDFALALGLPSLLILAQGLIGYPYMVYIYPAYFGFVLTAIAASQWAWVSGERALTAGALFWTAAKIVRFDQALSPHVHVALGVMEMVVAGGLIIAMGLLAYRQRPAISYNKRRT